MSEVLSGRVSKHRRDRRVKNSTVLRMMAIMQEGNSEVPKEFLETGRTGRRNAMPDILHPQSAEASTADLPSRLQQLSATDHSDRENVCPKCVNEFSRCAPLYGATKPKKRSVWCSDAEAPQPGSSNCEQPVDVDPKTNTKKDDTPS